MRTPQAARALAILAGISTAVGMGSCRDSSSPETWSISGTVSGPVSQGVTVTLGGASGAATTTDVTGHYSFSGLPDGSYTVTPSLGGYAFDPASRSVSVSGADTTGQDFIAGAMDWRRAGAMAEARVLPKAATLPFGKVLVVGGLGDKSILSSAELFDPAAGTWAPTASMLSIDPYLFLFPHTVTALPSGAVFVNLPNFSQIYEPSTGTWALAGTMQTGGNFRATALLPPGRLLVTGGMSTASTEIYDLATGVWTLAAPMTMSRHYHTATTLLSGKVLVAAGHGSPVCCERTSELYDPARDTWTRTGSLASARVYHTATLLQSGQVLVVGGMGSDLAVLASAELYDPATGAWTSAGSLAVGRFDHTATLLPSGEVLVAGGVVSIETGANAPPPTSSAELYDPGTRTWMTVAPLLEGRTDHATALLQSGEVLVVGGIGASGSLASAEIYTPRDLPFPATYVISGMVSGAAGQSVTVTLGGSATRTATTGASGHYAFAGLVDGSYTVTPSLEGYTFNPPNRSVTVNGADVGEQDFAASAPTHAISGTVAGAVSQGVAVTLSGASSASTTTNGVGYYAFTGLADGDYIVTPSLEGYEFNPPNRSVTVSGADVDEQDFAASVPSHTISGTVAGAVSQGVAVTLSGASSASTTTNGAGYYAFTGLANGDYTVTPSLAGYAFYPASRPVTVSGQDRGGQDFFGATSTCPSQDVAAPSVPSGVAVGGMSCMVLVHWQASSDDTGVVSYVIYRANAPLPLAVVDGTKTTYIVGASHPPPGTNSTVCYQVSALDCAGHESRRSAVACRTVSWHCGGI
jgi:hypothetical protein